MSYWPWPHCVPRQTDKAMRTMRQRIDADMEWLIERFGQPVVPGTPPEMVEHLVRDEMWRARTDPSSASPSALAMAQIIDLEAGLCTSLEMARRITMEEGP